MAAEFKAGERLLAYHGALIYRAKVLQVRALIQGKQGKKGKKGKQSKQDGDASDGTVWQFLVHYDGWNKKWDEWVTRDRVMPITPANLELQQTTKAEVAKRAQAKRSAQKSAVKTAARASAAQHAAAKRGVKRKINVAMDTEDTPMKVQNFKLPLPFALKKVLVDDWEAVTQKHKLLKLPRPQGVGGILDEFLKSRKKRDRVTVEVVESVRMYFKRALGTILLYRFERRQYQELLQSTGVGGDGSAGAGAGSSDRDNVDVCKVYGAEHLLRLLVKLPGLLAGAILTQNEVRSVQARLGELVSYLTQNKATMFQGSEAYIEPSTEYLSAAAAAATAASKARRKASKGSSTKADAAGAGAGAGAGSGAGKVAGKNKAAGKAAGKGAGKRGGKGAGKATDKSSGGRRSSTRARGSG